MKTTTSFGFPEGSNTQTWSAPFPSGPTTETLGRDEEPHAASKRTRRMPLAAPIRTQPSVREADPHEPSRARPALAGVPRRAPRRPPGRRRGGARARAAGRLARPARPRLPRAPAQPGPRRPGARGVAPARDRARAPDDRPHRLPRPTRRERPAEAGRARGRLHRVRALPAAGLRDGGRRRDPRLGAGKARRAPVRRLRPPVE